MCVTLSAISYNNKPVQLQSIGRIRTKKQKNKTPREERLRPLNSSQRTCL